MIRFRNENNKQQFNIRKTIKSWKTQSLIKGYFVEFILVASTLSKA